VRIEAPSRRPHGIRLTPLIDVVFILLVFFMLASSFLDWRALDLGVPSAEAKPDPQTDPIVIALDAEGAASIAGETVSLSDLPGRVRRLRSGDPRRPVVVQPAPKTPVGETVEVLDGLHAGGLESLSLAQEPT